LVRLACCLGNVCVKGLSLCRGNIPSDSGSTALFKGNRGEKQSLVLDLKKIFATLGTCLFFLVGSCCTVLLKMKQKEAFERKNK